MALSIHTHIELVEYLSKMNYTNTYSSIHWNPQFCV